MDFDIDDHLDDQMFICDETKEATSYLSWLEDDWTLRLSLYKKNGVTNRLGKLIRDKDVIVIQDDNTKVVSVEQCKPNKSDLHLKVRCKKCNEFMDVEFDDDGEPKGEIMAGDFRYSPLFDDIVVPLYQGFMHMHCQHKHSI